MPGIRIIRQPPSLLEERDSGQRRPERRAGAPGTASPAPKGRKFLGVPTFRKPRRGDSRPAGQPNRYFSSKAMRCFLSSLTNSSWNEIRA